VPTEPARLHWRHVPVHELLQQTPSTHWPEAHSQPAVHAVPFERLAWQLVPMQAKPAAHCVAEHPFEQLVEQAPDPLHT
jgi:hypothetical protein